MLANNFLSSSSSSSGSLHIVYLLNKLVSLLHRGAVKKNCQEIQVVQKAKRDATHMGRLEKTSFVYKLHCTRKQVDTHTDLASQITPFFDEN